MAGNPPSPPKKSTRSGGKVAADRPERRLDAVQIYILIDGRASIRQFSQIARTLVAAGVGAIQLREKRLADRELLDRAHLLREVTSGSGVLFLVNDRADIAAAAEADGVHLGQDDLPVSAARRILGPARLIGVSTHSIDQARQAVRDGADYIGCGPTFPSQTKQFDHFAGLEFLRAVRREIRLPAFAIGGVNRHNIDQVIAAGFSRVAVSGAVLGAPDPAAEVRALVQKLQAAQRTTGPETPAASAHFQR